MAATTATYAVDARGDHVGRWADLDGLLLREGNLTVGGVAALRIKGPTHQMTAVRSRQPTCPGVAGAATLVGRMVAHAQLTPAGVLRVTSVTPPG